METYSKTLTQLLSGVQAGERVSLEELLARLHKPVRTFLRGRIPQVADDPDLLDEATQSALIEITRSTDNCRAATDREVIAWSLTIARRSGMAALKSWVIGGEPLYSADKFTGSPTPSSTASAVLVNIIASLPSDSQDLLWERLAGDTWPQIGDRRRIAAAAAKRRWQRLIPQLRSDILRSLSDLPPIARAETERYISREHLHNEGEIQL